MNKAEAGKLGGMKTVERHGSSYMSEIGRRGAARFWQKYTTHPAGTSGWLIIERSTNKVIGSISYLRLR